MNMNEEEQNYQAKKKATAIVSVMTGSITEKLGRWIILNKIFQRHIEEQEEGSNE